jgi:hypothetical protein
VLEHDLAYDPGEIYFIREREVETGVLTPLVKIGLVRSSENRGSYDRLREHQTGNPRPLVLSESSVVPTDAVDYVEVQLHRRLAARRVTGEWFRFDSDDELDQAISLARILSHEMSEHRPLFEKAEELKSTPDNGATTAPSELAQEAARNLVLAEWKVDQCKELEDSIRGGLKSAIETGKDVKGAASIGSRTYRPKFDKGRFQEDHAELYQEFLVSSTAWYQRFLVDSKFRKSIDPAEDSSSREFIDDINRVRALVGEVYSGDHAYLLNEPQVQLTALKGLADWEQALAEVRLKVECGTNLGLNALCKWSRRETERYTFDEVAFREKHPDLFYSYMTELETSSYVRVKQSRI